MMNRFLKLFSVALAFLTVISAVALVMPMAAAVAAVAWLKKREE